MSLTQDTLQKIAAGVATATLVALGGTTITSLSTNARQDAEIMVLKESAGRIEKLTESLNETNKNVLILNAKIDAEKELHNVPSD